MSTVELEGVTVYVSAIESVEDGVSVEYENLYRRAKDDLFFGAMRTGRIRSTEEIEQEIADLPKEEDYRAVVVKLTSGREFRIVGKTRKEVEVDIFLAKRRDRS